MSDNGYILAYRSAWHHEVFNDLLEAAIWNYLFQNAFWKDGIKNMNGTVFHLKRGQIVTAPRYLAKGFRVSERVARNVIQKLEKCGMVVTQKTNKGTIITICNYDKFQTFKKTKDAQDVNQEAIKRQSKDANKNKINKIKEDKEVNITRAKKIDALSVNDVSDWLEQKRVAGKYITIDEHELLEMFKDYCRSKNPAYKDYVAAYRNSFKWTNAPKKGSTHEQSTYDIAREIAAEYYEPEDTANNDARISKL